MAIAVVLSGGVGARMGFSNVPKQYIKVGGRSILEYTLEALKGARRIEGYVIVAEARWRDYIAKNCSIIGIDVNVCFADPGRTRQESVLNGLRSAAQLAPEDDLVVVHDAARPNISKTLVDEYIACCEGYDGVIPVLPMKDTVYICHEGTVRELLDRSVLFAGQAPEVFRLSRYLAINENASPKEIENTRGSTEIAFRNGMSIKTVGGSEDNYKITTVNDLERFCGQMGVDFEKCVASVIDEPLTIGGDIG